MIFVDEYWNVVIDSNRSRQLDSEQTWIDDVTAISMCTCASLPFAVSVCTTWVKHIKDIVSVWAAQYSYRANQMTDYKYYDTDESTALTFSIKYILYFVDIHLSIFIH